MQVAAVLAYPVAIVVYQGVLSVGVQEAVDHPQQAQSSVLLPARQEEEEAGVIVRPAVVVVVVVLLVVLPQGSHLTVVVQGVVPPLHRR